MNLHGAFCYSGSVQVASTRAQKNLRRQQVGAKVLKAPEEHEPQNQLRKNHKDSQRLRQQTQRLHWSALGTLHTWSSCLPWIFCFVLFHLLEVRCVVMTVLNLTL